MMESSESSLLRVRHVQAGDLPLKITLSFECSYCKKTKDVFQPLSPGYHAEYGGEYTPSGWTWLDGSLVCPHRLDS